MLHRLYGLFSLFIVPACCVVGCAISGDTLFQAGFEMSGEVTRHIAASGDDSQPGSWSSPWRHVQHAVHQAHAGGIACVRPHLQHGKMLPTRPRIG